MMLTGGIESADGSAYLSGMGARDSPPGAVATGAGTVAAGAAVGAAAAGDTAAGTGARQPEAYRTTFASYDF
jgi:hypothetical protein